MHMVLMAGYTIPNDKEFDPIEQEKAIKDGVLYPYCKDIRLYRCPAVLKEQMDVRHK